MANAPGTLARLAILARTLALALPAEGAGFGWRKALARSQARAICAWGFTLSHVIAMSGTRGCLPEYCDAFDTAEEAAENMARIFELGPTAQRQLENTGYIEDGMPAAWRLVGAQYIELIGCNCETRDVHTLS